VKFRPCGCPQLMEGPRPDERYFGVQWHEGTDLMVLLNFKPLPGVKQVVFHENGVEAIKAMEPFRSCLGDPSHLQCCAVWFPPGVIRVESVVRVYDEPY
jgi:hypothetical protein